MVAVDLDLHGPLSFPCFPRASVGARRWCDMDAQALTRLSRNGGIFAALRKLMACRPTSCEAILVRGDGCGRRRGEDAFGGGSGGGDAFGGGRGRGDEFGGGRLRHQIVERGSALGLAHLRE